MAKAIFLLCIVVAFSMHAGFAQTTSILDHDFNEYVLYMLKTYPTNGTHTYYWPSSGTWAGNTRDLNYKGELFCKGDPQGRCYCCGLTFEVFFRAYEQYCKAKGWPFIIKDFDAAALKKFQRQWFGSDGNRKTLLNALVANSLGYEVALQNAKAGDFVQLWRHSGSGHSVILIGFIRDANQKITGIEYWSTQTSTNGVGYRTEYFGTTTGVDINQLYIARVGKK